MTRPRERAEQRSSSLHLERFRERFSEYSIVLCRNIGASVLSCFNNPYLRRGKELPKVIVTRSFTTALLRCFIHLLPMAITAVVAYLNLSGYFIGDQLAGGPGARALDFLLIQIAAKVMELCIVASLASTVLDLVRHQALAKDGIPLGLLCSSFRFAQLSYFWSPEYVFGGLGIKSWKNRMFFMNFLVLCGLLAIFAGPSSALLMVPAVRNSWPAGGTDFWLIGTDDTLWPDHLNSTHVGSESCRNPSKTNLTTAPLYMAGCIWHGYTQLAEGLKDRHFDWQSNITINDGIVKRQLTRRQLIASGTETWVLGVHVAASWLSRVLADEWGIATRNASSAQGSRWNARLKNATDGYGVTKVDTWLPVSRVACFNYPHIGGQTNLTLHFSALPEFAPRSKKSFPVDLQLIHSTTDITTQWVQPPQGTRDNHLTAALVVRIPHGTDDASAFTCSIDARWARGTNIGTGLPNTDNMLVHGALKTTRAPSANASYLDSSTQSYLPSPGPDWRFVSADPTWLDALMPPITSISTNNNNRHRSRPGWTTLAAALTNAGFDNSTGAVSGGWSSLGGTIESTLATVVVDGLSRIGLAANGGAGMRHVMPDRYQWLRFLPDKYVPSKAPSYFDRLLAGRTVVLPPTEDQEVGPPWGGGGGLVRLRWGVTVSGLAFKADGVVYYLALTVLFTHILIASAHTAWMLVGRRSSEAWDGIEQLVVLGCQSRQPICRGDRGGRLRNTCGGIRYGRTFQCSARIAVVRGNSDSLIRQDGEEEAVQLLLDQDVSDGTRDLEEVRENISYGVASKA